MYEKWKRGGEVTERKSKVLKTEHLVYKVR
jgi:hypothetical protein